MPGLADLPLEPVVMDMLVSARLVQRVQLIKGLTAGTVARAGAASRVATSRSWGTLRRPRVW
jgi:hypothetical protein